ncbi:RNA polymerase sigma factor [Actinoplanes sp. NPDC049265]|uniref:RNA polymerase sigma factor n=1 Tax=Actinoplanes sp. NPDC049265 TaxID=3363902 RepID=UPI0037248310
MPTLVTASLSHDSLAWDELVRRYAGLVLFVVRSYRLSRADEEAVARVVWLRLVEQLDRVPADTLPVWLAATTRAECTRVQRLRPDESDEVLRAASRHQALRDALEMLSPADRDLLTMLAAEPPCPDVEISRALDIPISSVGPARVRVLATVRSYLVGQAAA